MKIGSYLKSIRRNKNYTLAEVAARLDISASLLSQIENDKATPSLQSLEDILHFYAVNLSDFFKQVEQKRYLFQKKSETESYGGEELGFKLTYLASKLANNALESFVVELYPGTSIETAALNPEINAERFIYGMEGNFSIIIEEETLEMEPGDSINYKSFIVCKIHNDSEKTVKFLISGMPPNFL